MKTTKDYLKQTSKHLFQFKSTINDDHYFMKVIVNEGNNTFNVLKLDNDLKLKSNREYSISDWSRVSSTGKTYVPTELKNFILFYRDWDNIYKIQSIKHFKAIKEQIEKCIDTIAVAV